MIYKKQLVAVLMAVIATIGVLNAQQKYAVIITGDNDAVNVPVADQWNNGQGMGTYGYDEFWNDTYLMWEMLYLKKGYTDENIFVLYDDGNDLYFLEQDDRYNALETYNFNITDQASTMSNVQTLFKTTLPSLITENDYLFVWVMSHGGTDGAGSYFYSSDAQKIYDTKLATWLSGVDAFKKTVMISAPSSGGFAPELENANTIVYASSQQGENASRANNTPFTENEILSGITYHHGEFNFHTYSPINGASPDYSLTYGPTTPFADADLNNDHVVSIAEAVAWETTYEDGPETSVLSDIDNIAPETSLEYPSVISDNVVIDKTLKGIVYISKPVHVTTGATLTLAAAKVYLDYIAELTIDDGGFLTIESNLTGNSHIMAIEYVYPITVDGGLSVGDGTIFESTMLFPSLTIKINNTSLALTMNDNNKL